MGQVNQQDLRCKKCNGALDQVKRRWFERLFFQAAFGCTWCGRRRRVLRFTSLVSEPTEALDPKQLDQAKQTFAEDSQSAEKEKSRLRQPVG